MVICRLKKDNYAVTLDSLILMEAIVSWFKLTKRKACHQINIALQTENDVPSDKSDATHFRVKQEPISVSISTEHS